MIKQVSLGLEPWRDVFHPGYEDKLEQFLKSFTAGWFCNKLRHQGLVVEPVYELKDRRWVLTLKVSNCWESQPVRLFAAGINLEVTDSRHKSHTGKITALGECEIPIVDWLVTRMSAARYLYISYEVPKRLEVTDGIDTRHRLRSPKTTA